MTRFNKATAAVVAGAAVSIAAAFIDMDTTLQEAIKIVIVAAMVWLIPNEA